MADLAVTNTTLAAKNIGYPVTANVSDVDVANSTQKYVFTPNKSDERTLIRIQVANTHGAVGFSIAAGDFWMGIAAIAGSVAQNTAEVIEIETAKYMQSDGTIEITFTPASDKKLQSEHVLTVEAYSMV